MSTFLSFPSVVKLVNAYATLALLQHHFGVSTLGRRLNYIVVEAVPFFSRTFWVTAVLAAFVVAKVRPQRREGVRRRMGITNIAWAITAALRGNHVGACDGADNAVAAEGKVGVEDNVGMPSSKRRSHVLWKCRRRCSTVFVNSSQLWSFREIPTNRGMHACIIYNGVKGNPGRRNHGGDTHTHTHTHINTHTHTHTNTHARTHTTIRWTTPVLLPQITQ